MIIKRTVVTEHEISLPEVACATLPSEEEISEAEGLIGDAKFNDAPRTYSPYYYLRTPGEEYNTIMVACGDEVDDETEPDFDDMGPEDDYEDIHYGTGNRPILVFEESLFDAGAKPGDTFEIGWGWHFTVIGEKVAICDELISVDVFDDETNIYEESAIKQRVDEWFENEIKPNL